MHIHNNHCRKSPTQAAQLKQEPKTPQDLRVRGQTCASDAFSLSKNSSDELSSFKTPWALLSHKQAFEDQYAVHSESSPGKNQNGDPLFL